MEKTMIKTIQKMTDVIIQLMQLLTKERILLPDETKRAVEEVIQMLEGEKHEG